MELGTRLRKLRTEARLTQKELAEPTYTAAYVSTIEAGKRQPSSKALQHLAAKLGVDPDELLTGRSPDLTLRLEDRYVEGRRLLAEGHSEKAESTFTQLKREAKRYGLVLLEAKAEFGRGLCAEVHQDLAGAIERYDSTLQLLTGESPLASIDAIAGKARCLQMTGEMRYAIHLLEKALAVLRWEGLEDPSALVRLHTSLVAAYFHVGLYREADASAQEALRLAPRVDDAERVAGMHINVARISLERKHLEEAERHYVQAEELFRNLGYKLDEARVQLARGFGLREANELDRAREHLTVAVESFMELSSPLNEARAINELARVERLAGNTADAKMLLRRSLNLSEDGGPEELAIAHREVARCDAESDQAAAEKGLRRAIALFEEADSVHELATTYRELGDLLRGREELSDACDAYRAAAVALEVA
jgi:tetratricopeptide (TPR) repeat protein